MPRVKQCKPSADARVDLAFHEENSMQLVQRQTVNAPIERLFDLVRSIQAHEATSSIDGRAVSGKPLVCGSRLCLSLKTLDDSVRLRIW